MTGPVPSTLDELRASMPALQACTFLNTGASSPDSEAVVEEIQRFLEHHGYESPAADGMYEPVYEVVDETRRDVAAFLGADPREIALTQSTGDGVSRIANAISWTGDETVVRTDLEHPAGIVPWQTVQRDHGIDIEVLETSGGKVDVDDLQTVLTDVDADLLCLSSIVRGYGTRQPLPEICEVAHDADCEVLVDAVQSVGQAPVDVREWGADYVAAASHKWLVGPWGAGFCYVAEDRLDDLEPRHVSYGSVDRDTPTYDLHPDARQLEVGTVAPAPLVGLQTALATMERIGVDRVERRIEELTDLLKAELPASKLISPQAFESGIVVVVDDTPEETASRVADRGVRIRSIADPSALRISIHAYNTEADVRRFLEAYEEATR